MPRKKSVPNRRDGRYEVKITVGKTLQGKLIRKSFYSTISKADAQKQADTWKINQKVSEITGTSFIESPSCSFERWALVWLKNYKEKAVRRITFEETYQSTVLRYLIPRFGKAAVVKLSSKRQPLPICARRADGNACLFPPVCF